MRSSHGAGNLVPATVRWHHHAVWRPARLPYLPWVLLAGLGLAALAWLPVDWFRQLFLVPTRVPEAAAPTPHAGAIRLVEVPSPPAPSAALSVAAPKSIPETGAVEQTTPVQTPRDFFDPTTPFRSGRQELLKTPSLTADLSLGHASSLAAGLALPDSLELARSQFAAYGDAFVRSHAADWMEEKRRERFEEWWQKYVIEDLP